MTTDPMVSVLLFLILVLWLPGLSVLYAAGWRTAPAVIAAPPVSVALAGGGAVILGWLNFGWSPIGCAGITALAVLTALGFRAVLGRAEYVNDLNGDLRSNSFLIGGVLVGAVVQLMVIVPGMRDLGMPVQNRDAVFHMNAVQSILETGNASTFGGLAPMYGGGATPTYPAAWHDLVSLVTGPLTVVEGSNLLAILVSVVVYPTGMALFARSLTSARSWAGPIAPVIASGATVFPPAVMFFHGQWPFGLSLSLVPAVLALAVSARKNSLTAMISVLVAALGALLAHPSTAGVFAAVLLAVAISQVFVLGMQEIKAGRRGRGTLILVADIVAIVGIGIVLTHLLSKLGMADFARPTSGRYEAFLNALSLRTIGPYAWSETSSNLVALALLGVGIYAASKVASNLWLVFTWATFVLLSAVAVGPDGMLRSLTALWYKDELRMRAILTVFVVTLCALGFAWLLQTLGSLAKEPKQARVQAVIAVTIVMALGLTTMIGHRNLRLQQWVGAGYQPQFMAAPPLADENELRLIRSLDTLLPEDAVILGDPLSGAVLVQAMTGRIALIPVVGASGLGAEQLLIMNEFNEIASEKRICEAIAQENEGGGDLYLYWDTPEPVFLGAIDPAPGFVDVTGVPDLKLVVQEGDVSVWLVDTCSMWGGEPGG